MTKIERNTTFQIGKQDTGQEKATVTTNAAETKSTLRDEHDHTIGRTHEAMEAKKEALYKEIMFQNKIILPESRFRTHWDTFLVYWYLFSMFVLPYGVAFVTSGHKGFLVFELISFGLYTLDIVFNVRTTFHHGQGYETASWPIMLAYIKKYFVADVLAVAFILPINAVVWDFHLNPTSYVVYKIMRLFPLVKMLGLRAALKRLEWQSISHDTLYRLAKMIITLLLLLHWTGCSYWIVGQLSYTYYRTKDRSGLLPWCPQVENPLCDGSGSATRCGEAYLRSVMWALSIVTGGGNRGTPNNQLESVYEIIVTVIVVMVYTVMIGTATSIVQSLNALETERKSRMSSIVTALQRQKVPINLQKRVLQFYEYFWTTAHGPGQGQEELKEIHPCLQMEMAVTLNSRLLEKVPVFQGIGKACMAAIVARLRVRIYLPAEWVLQQGDVTSRMYFILGGSFQIEQNGEVVSLLEEGNFFGEHSIFDANAPSPVSARSLDYSELRVLYKSDIDAVQRNFPRFVERLRELGNDKRRYTDLDSVHARLSQFNQQSHTKFVLRPTKPPNELARMRALLGGAKEDDEEEPDYDNLVMKTDDVLTRAQQRTSQRAMNGRFSIFKKKRVGAAPTSILPS